MSNIFKTPATLASIKSRVDRSYAVCFNTQEIDPVSVAELSSNLQVFGMLGFTTSDTAIDELDWMEVPEEILEVGQKSFAERVRAIAFLRWKNKGESGSFEAYHLTLKEQIITSLKKGLPPKGDA